jgi:CBS domain-containing protein
MPIGDYCQRDVRTVDGSETLREAAKKMAEEGVGSLVVLQGRHPRGLLTDRDLALRVLRNGADADVMTALEAVSGDLVVVHETSPLRAATAVMRRSARRRLPVVDAQGELVGVIAFDDVLRLVARELMDVSEVVASQAPSGTSPLVASDAPEVE